MKQRLLREVVRFHAIFRAVAPFLPNRVVRILRRLKTGVAANRIVRFALRRPMPDRRRPSTEVKRLFDDGFYGLLTGSHESRDELLAHYRRFGWQSGLDPHPLFDVRFYLEQAEQKGVEVEGDPFEHYLGGGWAMGLEPNNVFDGAWYSASVSLVGSCPLAHYLDHGQWSGRPTSPSLARALLPGSRPTEESISPAASIPRPESGVRLLTVDFWDTLVVRTRPSDSAKLATARRIASELRLAVSAFAVMNRRVRIEAELAASTDHEEYEITSVISKLICELSEGSHREMVDRIVAAEVADECRHTRLQPEVAHYLNEVRATPGGPKVAILSDFYMKASELRTILRSHGIDFEESLVISSCEHLASKRLGTLYPLVHTMFGISPEQHLHIGDNPHSDVGMAMDSGAQAFLFSVDREYPGPGKLSKEWFASGPFDEGCSRVGSLLAGDKNRSLPEKRALFAGARNAFLPLALVFAAAQRANERGLDRVFYVSREGAFLAELHRWVRDEHPELNFPHPLRLEVSRRSTFGPSLTRIDGPSLDRLWSQYPNQSMNGLLRSLGVEPTLFEDGLRRFDLDPDDLIHDIRSNARVREFLADREVHEALLEKLSLSRECLIDYLRDRGLTTDEVLVVDLGWRGTIQDNLAHVLNEVHFHGVYLGLFPYLNKQVKNVSKEGLAFDGNLGAAFDHVSPPAVLESPLTPDIPSAVGYLRLTDGRVRVIFEAEEGRAVHLITSFQDGVRMSLPYLVDHFVANGYDFNLLSIASEAFVKRYYTDPDPGVADIWFGSAHDDTFGASNLTPFEKRFDPSSIYRAAGDLTKIEAAIESGWPLGYMKWLPAHSAALTYVMRRW